MGVISGIRFGFIVLFFVFDLGRSELYPSIQWTPLNPIFATNRTQCVHPMSKLIFVCPNTATVVTKIASSSSLDPQYENLWLVSRHSYERCEVNTSADHQLILCDKPFELKYQTVIFKRYSASDDPQFKPGKDYYFIATSDGKQSSIRSTSGGNCRTHNMKLKFHICTSSNDRRCESNDMCNGIIPTQAQTTAMPTKPPTTAAVTTQMTKSTSSSNYTLPTTSVNNPANPENERLLVKESTYLITIGVLVFMCVILLIISAIFIFRLHRKKKDTSSSSRDSASYVIRVGTDSPDGDWD